MLLIRSMFNTSKTEQSHVSGVWINIGVLDGWWTESWPPSSHCGQIEQGQLQLYCIVPAEVHTADQYLITSYIYTDEANQLTMLIAENLSGKQLIMQCSHSSFVHFVRISNCVGRWALAVYCTTTSQGHWRLISCKSAKYAFPTSHRWDNVQFCSSTMCVFST